MHFLGNTLALFGDKNPVLLHPGRVSPSAQAIKTLTVPPAVFDGIVSQQHTGRHPRKVFMELAAPLVSTLQIANED